MKQKGRYQLMNDNGVMWQRRWFWKFFSDFESFENREIKQQEKILKKLGELKKEVDKYREITRDKQNIIREIQTARDCPKNCGPDKVREFGFFDYFKSRIADLPPAAKGWKEIVAYLKGSGNRSIAENVAGTIGAEVTQINGETVADAGHRERGELEVKGGIVTNTSHAIRPESNNQQKKQQNNQGKQQQNNH